MNKDYFINKLHELEHEQNMDENSISLYDVFTLIHNVNLSYSKLITDFQNEATSILNNKYPYSNIMIYDFDYDMDYLSIGYINCNRYYDIVLSKEDKKLFVVSTNISEDCQILDMLGNYLSYVYDKFLDYKHFIKMYNNDIRIKNSNFYININRFGIKLFYMLNNDILFETESFNRNGISFYDNIFKNIYINIADTPSWAQNTLYELRNSQIEYIRKQSIKNNRKLMVKSFFSKIFNTNNK